MVVLSDETSYEERRDRTRSLLFMSRRKSDLRVFAQRFLWKAVFVESQVKEECPSFHNNSLHRQCKTSNSLSSSLVFSTLFQSAISQEFLFLKQEKRKWQFKKGVDTQKILFRRRRKKVMVLL